MRSLATIALLFSMISLSSCGYRPVRDVVAGSPKLRVIAGVPMAPGGFDVAVGDELALGARVELARWGALSDSDGADVDRMIVLVVRIDERSEGVTAIDDGTGKRPIARGVRVRVTARSEVKGTGGELETPDVDADEVVATPTSTAEWQGARAAATRSAARRAGAMLARNVLGIPG